MSNLRQIPQIPAIKKKFLGNQHLQRNSGVKITHKSGHSNSLSFLFPPAMYSGICICVFLAVLSVSSFGQQTGGSHNDNFLAAELEQSLTEHHRHARAPLSTGPLKSAPRLDGSLDQRASIGALLAKYLQQARKGTGYVLLLYPWNFLQRYLDVNPVII